MNLQAQTRLEASNYDRSACKIGLVHLGYGAFHRAHQAVYVDQYMDKTGDLDWGIAAVNLRDEDSPAFADNTNIEDGYLLKTTSPSGDIRYQQVRPHIAFADWSKDAERAEQLLDLETVHALTVTVTESGYFLTNDWTLNTDAPAIAKEIEGGDPTTVYAYLARALARRAAGNGQPITILCCDNIRSNGKMLERNFLHYLQVMKLDGLAQWVRANVTFPCSMVDRITPRTSAALLAEVCELFPEQNLAPVHGESFIQWVVEDKFAAAMPDLGEVGVQVVDDVDPYEEAKIRILNGGHTGLCYLGALAGYHTFDEGMRDADLRHHFDRYEIENVLLGLDIELPFDKHAYLDQIASRFENRAIADDLARICMDGWSKMPIFIRPTLEGCYRQGISPKRSYDCVASWYVFARRVAAGTMHVEYREPYWDDLAPLLERGAEKDFARCPALWADLPERYEEFAPGIMIAINEMEEKWPA